MMRYLSGALFFLLGFPLAAQNSTEYQKLRTRIVAKFQNSAPGKFGPFVKGVEANIVTDKKILALTFDACGGHYGNGFDRDIIQYLKQERIYATLFLTGRWIDDHPAEVKQLAADTLFEIENHGLMHRPCSVEGKSMYGIQGTANVCQAVDEIEMNAIKIQHVTGRKPIFFRSATAMTDEACGEIATELGETIVSYDILSGDAVGGTPARTIVENIVKKAHPGAIVIMHMNHPEWDTFEALRVAIPRLRKMGYTFVKLQNHQFKGKQ